MRLVFCSFCKVIILTVLISSCGFRPINQNVDGISHSAIPALEIAEINSVDGAILYEALRSLIPNSSCSRYILEISLSETSQNSLLSKKSDTLEKKIIQHVSFKLIDSEVKKEVLQQKFSIDAHYGAMYSPYSSYIEYRGAKESLSKLAADEIYRRLIMFFYSNSSF